MLHLERVNQRIYRSAKKARSTESRRWKGRSPDSRIDVDPTFPAD